MTKKRLGEDERVRVGTRIFVRALLILGAILVAIYFLRLLTNLILMLIMALFLSYLIAPVVQWFEHPVYISGREVKLPRSLAVGLVYVVFGVVMFGSISLFWPLFAQQANELRLNLGEYIASGTEAARQTFSDANSWVRHMPGDWRDFIVARVNQIAENLAPRIQDLLLGALGVLSYLQYLPWLIIVPIVSFFMLKDAKLFERAIIEFAPNERLQRRFHWLLADVSRTLAAYIRAQITACIEIGAIVTLVFWAGGVPYAVLLGLISGIAEFVPMIGPLFAAVVTIALTMTVSFKMAIIVGIFLGVLRLAQDYIIYPRIVGHGIKMHPLIVILAILGGAEVGGLVGIFLSVPLVALVIVAYNHYVAYRGLQSLSEAQTASDT